MLSAAPYASTDTADSTHAHTLPSAILCAAQSRQHKRHFCTHIAQFYLHIARYGRMPSICSVCVCVSMYCLLPLCVPCTRNPMCPFIDIAFMLRVDVVICCANRCYRNRSQRTDITQCVCECSGSSAPCSRIMNEIQ